MANNSIQSWGAVDSPYFRGLEGLKYNGGIPEEVKRFPGYNSMDYNSFIEKYGDYKPSDGSAFDVNQSYMRSIIKSAVGNERYAKEYDKIPFEEAKAKYEEELRLNIQNEALAEARNEKAFNMSEEERMQSLVTSSRELKAIQFREHLKKNGITSSKQLNFTGDVKEMMDNQKKFLNACNEMGITEKEGSDLIAVGGDFDDIDSVAIESEKENALLGLSFNEEETTSLLNNAKYILKYYDEDNAAKPKLLKEKVFKYDLEKYATDIYNKAASSDFNRAKYLQMFENIASTLDPYYKESLKYGQDEGDGIEHSIKPFVSEMDKPKILAQYLAVSALTGNEDLANQWLQDKLTDLRGASNSFWDNSKKAVKGIGADVYGSTLALAGMLSNIVPTILGIEDESSFGVSDEMLDSLDLNAFQKALFKLSDNDITKNALDVLNTGTVDKDQLAYNKAMDINALDVSYSKGWSLLQQSGYTTASVISTGGAALLTKGLVKAAGKAAGGVATAAVKRATTKGATEAAKKALRESIVKTTQNATKKAAAWTVVPAMTSYAEAVQDGYDVFERSLEMGNAEFERLAQENMSKELQFDSDTGTFSNIEFDNYYNENNEYKKKFDSYMRYLENKYKDGIPEGDAEKYKAEVDYLKELQQKANEEINTIANDYYNKKYKSKIESEDAQRMVIQEAVRAFANTTATEQVIISATDLLGSKIFAPETKWMRKIYGGNTNRYIRTKLGKNGYEIAAKGYNYVKETFKDAASEFTEEYLQSITGDTNTDLAKTDIQNYFYNSINPDSSDKLGYGLFQNIGSIANAMGQSAISQEALEAGSMGFMGALLGAFDGNVFGIGRRISDVRTASKEHNYNKWQTAAGYINTVWRSPLLYNATNAADHKYMANKVAADVRQKLDEDPKFRAAFESASALNQYVDEFNRARANNDAVDMEESDLAGYLEGINILSKMQGTSMADRFWKTLDEISQASSDDPRVQEMAEQTKAEMNREGQTLSDADVLAMVQGRIKNFRELYKKEVEYLDDIDTNFEDAVDDRTKKALVFSRITAENREKMLAARENTIKEETEKNEQFRQKIQEQQREASALNNTEKKLVAKYGSIENAKKKYEEEVKAKGGERTLTKTERKALKRDLRDLRKEDERKEKDVMNESEILSLDASSRADMLDTKNKNRYNKEQQEVINNLNSALSDKAKIAIKEAGKIKSLADLNEKIMSDIKGSAADISSLQYRLKINADRLNAHKKLDKAKGAKTYEEFEKLYDEAYDTMTNSERIYIGTILNTPQLQEFYKRIIKRNRTVAVQRQLASTIKANAGRLHKRIINLITDELIKRNGGKKDKLNVDDAVNLLVDGGFLNTLKQNGINWESFSEEEQGQVLSELTEHLNKVNAAEEKRQVIDRAYNQEHNKDNRQEKTSESKDDTLFDKETYRQNKKVYDPIIEKIARIFSGSKERLTVSELFKIVSLLNRKNETPIDADINFFNNETVDISTLYGLLSFARKAMSLREKSLVNDGQSTTDFSILNQLCKGIESLAKLCHEKTPIQVIGNAAIEVNPDFKDSFDKRIIEKGEEKKKRGLKKLGKNGEMKLDIKLAEDLSTEQEKEFYKTHHVEDNVTWVCQNMKPKDVKMVIVQTSDILDSSITYTDDTYPLAVAVKVASTTPNAVKVGNEYLLFVGVAGNSRASVTSEGTVMNEIRDALLHSDFEDNSIVSYTNGKHIQFAGWNLRIADDSGERTITNFTDYLMSPKDKGGLGLSEKAAFEHFRKNTVVVSAVYEKDAEGKRKKAILSFEWNGKKYTQVKMLDEESVYSNYELLAYINPNEPFTDSPTLNYLFVSGVNSLEYKGKDLKGILTEESIFDGELQNSDMSFIYELGQTLRKRFVDHIKSLKKMQPNSTAFNDTIRNWENELNQNVGAYFNMGKPYGMKPLFEFHMSINKDGNITVSLFNTLTKKTEVYKTLNAKKLDDVPNFVQELLMDSLLEKKDDGTYAYRMGQYTDGGQYEKIKLQVSYRYFKEDTKKDPDPKSALYDAAQKAFDKVDKFRKIYFHSKCLEMDSSFAQRKTIGISSTAEAQPETPTTTSAKPSIGVDSKPVIEVKPDTRTPEKRKQDVIDFLASFKLTKGRLSDARNSGHIGVTTFIATEETKVDPNEATEFGTSIDSVVRLFFSEAGGRNARSAYEYIRGKATNNECPITGFNWSKLRNFLLDIEANYKTFFEARGETVVPFDLLFNGTLESISGKVARLTMIPDIVTVDNEGNLHIYDMKSYRGENRIKTISNTFGDAGLAVHTSAWLEANMEKWRKQVSLYAHLITRVTGLQVASIGILPIALNYARNSGVVLGEKSELTGAQFVYQGDGKTPMTIDTINIYSDAIKFDALKLEEIESNKWLDKEDLGTTPKQTSINDRINESEKNNNEKKTEEGKEEDKTPEVKEDTKSEAIARPVNQLAETNTPPNGRFTSLTPEQLARLEERKRRGKKEDSEEIKRCVNK